MLRPGNKVSLVSVAWLGNWKKFANDDTIERSQRWEARFVM